MSKSTRKPTTPRVQRIRDRIKETTEKARENFIPVDGPDPRMHRYEVPSAVHQQTNAAGSSFEDSFGVTDPYDEQWVAGSVDGVIQLEVLDGGAAEEALAKAIVDPASILNPVEQYAEGGRPRDIVDAGHELAKRSITDAYDPEHRARVREGLGITAADEDRIAEDFGDE